MKKLITLAMSFISLASAGVVLAADGIDINITQGAGQGIPSTTDIGVLFGNIITIVFILAALLVLVFLIIGAFQWITSGGDKEAVGKARNRITHALIGLAILALAFLIVRVAGNLLNVDILGKNLHIPTLSECPAGTTSVGGACQPRTP